jgi:hypothetical protein
VPDEEPTLIGSGTPSACSDGAYKLSGHRWRSQYRWRFAAGTTPSGLNVDNVEQALNLKNPAAAITSSRNDCGLADDVSASQAYLGRTSATPDIIYDGALIEGMDGVSVVGFGFGDMPYGTLGFMLDRAYSDGTALEADFMLSTRYSWFPFGVPAGCSNKSGIQAAGTHQFGHVFGLGHVSEAFDPALTMSMVTSSCSSSAYTLGLGDVRGLRQLY